jgi:hypothetical protein
LRKRPRASSNSDDKDFDVDGVKTPSTSKSDWLTHRSISNSFVEMRKVELLG